ncbi:MAG TPA: PSD1 and planctomycete cytochrome C domain-containing protein [Verrucomicrobiae bacterium]
MRPVNFLRIAWLLVAAFATPLFAAERVDYATAVKPIFAENCYKCHGSAQQKGGLRMDTAALARKGGDAGALFEPGKAESSLLLKVLAGKHDDIPRMPYKKPPLTEVQFALIKSWINEGATAPMDEKPEAQRHWAFVPPQRTALPKVRQTDWPQNAVDYFILARLEKENIKPSPEADLVTLIRRLSMDLLGLPPTIQEVDTFLADKTSDAYDKLVKRLLDSPHYGERWGRWWLDLARYADSNGYSIDAPRQIWKYRDWVIAAMNRNLPMDQFMVWQLAGDLLPNATLEQKIATGFNRNTQINQEGGIDPEQFRVESVMDRVNTFGTAFLGLTIGCAQCHDHKFDPLKQKEYYQLYAFFNNTVQDGHGQGTPGGLLEIPGEIEPMESIEKELAETRADLERYLDTKGSEVVKWEQGLTDEARQKLKANVKNALKMPWDKMTLEQKRAVYGAFKSTDSEFKSRNSKLAKLEKREPKAVTTLVMAELPKPRESTIMIKGDFTRPGEKVWPATPAVLHEFGATNGNRLDLAKWLVDTNNPLTARVLVNRVWQQYFGRGLVETENDFGTQGSLPTHPELLDYLATELIKEKWNLKAIHRLIVTSATYRQSSHARPDLKLADPTNRLLARQNRLRLEAEFVRDVALAASGLLSPKIGGPPVYPPQPNGVMSLGQTKRDWKPSTGPERYRRGIYTYFWRATPHPALSVFDAPDAFSACTRRLRSNTPLQALTLLNDQQFYELAEALAERVQREGPQQPDAKLDYAFRLCLARKPDAEEKQRLTELYEQQLALGKENDTSKQKEAWATVARVLLNLDETITRE